MFTFIDLFAGIGGFRIACEQESGKCVFSSEIDKHACQTYKDNFGDDPFCDITKANTKDIPDFDLLCAGFPCQSFSMAGKRLGFNDTRGTLIFEAMRIIKEKQPKVFLLENVQGLLSHDEGRTFRIIRKLLGKTFNTRNEFFLEKDNLQYNIFYKVLNSADFGLAQNRKRIFIVGFRKDIQDWTKFKFPKGTDKSKVIKNILESNVDKKYFLSQEKVEKINENKRMQTRNNNSFEFRILNLNGKAYSLISQYSKTEGTVQILKENNRIRIFTPRECMRLQGFPESFKLPEKDYHAYHQLGNAVSPPVIKEIVKEIKKIILSRKT